MKIALYVQPGAKKTEIAGIHDGMVKLRVAAPPMEGAANRAIIAFLAKFLDISKSEISLVGGDKSRIKTFEIKNNTKIELDKINSLIGKTSYTQVIIK